MLYRGKSNFPVRYGYGLALDPIKCQVYYGGRSELGADKYIIS